MNPTPLSDEMLDTLQRETFEYFLWSCRQTSARAPAESADFEQAASDRKSDSGTNARRGGRINNGWYNIC